MTKKRYTITFDPKLVDIAEPLKRLEELGMHVESTQPFIGTAVVSGDSDQVERVQAMDAIQGIVETRLFQAM
jgi:hypothetical protein